MRVPVPAFLLQAFFHRQVRQLRPRIRCWKTYQNPAGFLQAVSLNFPVHLKQLPVRTTVRKPRYPAVLLLPAGVHNWLPSHLTYHGHTVITGKCIRFLTKVHSYFGKLTAVQSHPSCCVHTYTGYAVSWNRTVRPLSGTATAVLHLRHQHLPVCHQSVLLRKINGFRRSGADCQFRINPQTDSAVVPLSFPVPGWHCLNRPAWLHRTDKEWSMRYCKIHSTDKS